VRLQDQNGNSSFLHHFTRFKGGSAKVNRFLLLTRPCPLPDIFIMRSFIFSGVMALAAIARPTLADDGDDSEDTQTCFSYGIDFQNQGSYFQNVSSTDPFTFVSIFEGCQSDIANNIFVDPYGDEYQCTDTELQPDDVNQMSTCPLNKNDLYTGEWSVLLISNNGNAEPIAYERDFYLSVGTPVTSTVSRFHSYSMCLS
jgi:hypothetical protein